MAIGSLMLPAMIQQGYPKKFSTGLIACSGSLGILIPPSIVMIVYAVATSNPLARCSSPASSRASSWPGADGRDLRHAKKHNFPPSARQPQGGREVFMDAFWGLMLVVIVMGGIYGGVFTPTEAAAVSRSMLRLRTFIYRTLPFRDIGKVLRMPPTPRRCCCTHHQRHPVQLPAHLGTDPAGSGRLVIAQDLQAWQFLVFVNVVLLIAGSSWSPAPSS